MCAWCPSLWSLSDPDPKRQTRRWSLSHSSSPAHSRESGNRISRGSISFKTLAIYWTIAQKKQVHRAGSKAAICSQTGSRSVLILHLYFSHTMSPFLAFVLSFSLSLFFWRKMNKKPCRVHHMLPFCWRRWHYRRRDSIWNSEQFRLYLFSWIKLGFCHRKTHGARIHWESEKLSFERSIERSRVLISWAFWLIDDDFIY